MVIRYYEPHVHVYNVMSAFSLSSTARHRLKTLFSQSAFFFEKTDYINSKATPFHKILLDMSRYESDELVEGSLHLLNRCYSSEISLFESAVQTQLLLTKESQNVRTQCTMYSCTYLNGYSVGRVLAYIET